MIVDLDDIVLTPSGDISKWNAVGNPIVYKMQRKDFIFDLVNNSSGFVQLQFNGVDVSASFTVGHTIYLKSDNGTYDAFGTVTAKAFSTNTTVTTSITYTSAAPGGFVNNHTLRPLYRVEVEVYDSSNTLLNASPIVSTPTTKGALLVDVSAVLRSTLSPNNNADLTGSTALFNDSPVYKKFYIKYREAWTGSSESQTDDSANQLLSILGARQIPSTYGGNMYEYVSFDGSPLSSWLTKLSRPKLWRGYPNLLSIIASNANDYNFLVNYYDASGSLVGNNDSTLSNAGDAVISGRIDKVLAIPSNAVRAQVTFRDLAVGPSVTVLSNVINCDIVDPCDNPIMLHGRNSLGGILQWLFDVNQEYTFDYGNGTKAKRYILTAVNLTLNEWDALQDFINLGDVYKNNITELTSSTIKTSTRVGQQLYILNQDGTKIGVIARPTKNTTSTKQKKHVFQIEIEYPEIFAA